MRPVLAALQGFTGLSRACAGLLAAGFLAHALVPSLSQYTALVPGRFIPCVWNVFTAGLLETNLFKVGFDIVGILLLARLIEPTWGFKEFLAFISAVNLGTGLTTLVLVYVSYVVNQYSMRSADILYKEVYGFDGIIAACLVAVKQIMPDNEITLLGFIRFRVKHLPSLYVVFGTAAGLAVGSSSANIPFIWFGTYIAWFYLRFLQARPEVAGRGDLYNEEFKFSSFFPAFMQPAVDWLAGLLGAALRLGGSGQPTAAPPTVLAAPLPGSDNSDAARRRERGARALEERLGGKKKAAVAVPADVEAPMPTEAGDA